MARTDKRKEFLNDCFVTAFEGGIGYWSACADYDYPNTSATLYEYSDDYDDFGNIKYKEPVKVTMDTIARGVNRISKGTPEELGLHKDYIKDISLANRLSEWDSNMDATHGDVILQVALFGKVVYG